MENMNGFIETDFFEVEEVEFDEELFNKNVEENEFTEVDEETDGIGVDEDATN
jgi:hypothetical protein